MEAGRELDALVAAEVMGWEWFRASKHQAIKFLADPKGPYCRGCLYATDEPPAVDCDHDVPFYSIDITAAWAVVEKLRDKWPMLSVHLGGERCEIDGWACGFERSAAHKDGTCEVAETAPLAICLAALAAVGVEVPA